MARPLVVIDVGAAHVIGVTFSSGPGGRLRLDRLVAERQASISGGGADGIASACRSLASMAAAAGWQRSAAVLGVPGHLALTKFVRTPRVARAKRLPILQFEASQAIPYPLADVVWDHVVIADEGPELEVLLAAVKADTIADLCAGAAAAGLGVERAAVGGLALRRGFLFNHPDLRQPALLADVGARSSHLLLLDGPRFFLRTLPLGADSITQAVADELGLDFSDAEALKLAVLSERDMQPADSPAPAAVQRASAHFSVRLAQEIARSLAHARRQMPGESPTALWLTGGGAQLEALPAALAAKLRLPVERYDPLARVELGAEAKDARAAAASLAVLVGLAVPVSPAERDADLLPPALRESLAFRRRRPWFAAAAMLAAAALLPPIVHYHRVATRAAAQVAVLDARMRPMRSLQGRIAGDLERLESINTEIAALRRTAEARTSWLTFLADLQARLATIEDVWLERLAVMPPPATSATAPDGTPVGPAPLKLTVSGRLIDAVQPGSKAGADDYARVRRLLESFAHARFVASVGDERFDHSEPGILRFDVTLVIDPAHSL